MPAVMPWVSKSKPGWVSLASRSPRPKVPVAKKPQRENSAPTSPPPSPSPSPSWTIVEGRKDSGSTPPWPLSARPPKLLPWVPERSAAMRALRLSNWVWVTANAASEVAATSSLVIAPSAPATSPVPRRR